MNFSREIVQEALSSSLRERPDCPWQDDGPNGWEWYAPQHRRRDTGSWEDHSWHEPDRWCTFPPKRPIRRCAVHGCGTDPRVGNPLCWIHAR